MKIALTALMIMLSSILFAQYKQNLRGVVSDKASGAPLPAANVALVRDAETYGASSKEDGTYEISNVPVGRYNLVVRYIGYELFAMRNVELISGKEKVVNVSLTENVIIELGI